jgi:pimeloyl-ACP methyl ester carboxylesterase
MARQPYAPDLDTFVVSPENSRPVLSDFISGARRQLLIYDPKLTDRVMLRLLRERAKKGVEVRVLGKVGKVGKTAAGIDEAKLAGLRLHARVFIRDGRRAFYRNCREILDINLDYLLLLGQVKAPTLVLGGDCDRLVPPRGIRKYGELIAGARTVLFAKCAHLPNIERPDEFNQEVLAFLAEAPPA